MVVVCLGLWNCVAIFAKLIFTLYTSVSFIVKCVNFAFENTKVFRRNNLFFIRQSFFFLMHINLFFDALTKCIFVDDDFCCFLLQSQNFNNLFFIRQSFFRCVLMTKCIFVDDDFCCFLL